MKVLPSPGGLYSRDHSVYLLETGDPPRYWLHDGLSHECSYVWNLNNDPTFRPYKTKCGIQVTEHLEARTANLFNLVPVETTCLWCASGKVRE